MNRDYTRLLEIVEGKADRLATMQDFVDKLWEPMHTSGVSWLGFYIHEGGDELVLGPRRDKPACSPIGMHGACGQVFTARTPKVVRDVAELGENYIACDPRDRSEVVLPLFSQDGTCWGVLDLDSYDVGAFDEEDVKGLGLLLKKAGLTSRA